MHDNKTEQVIVHFGTVNRPGPTIPKERVRSIGMLEQIYSHKKEQLLRNKHANNTGQVIVHFLKKQSMVVERNDQMRRRQAHTQSLFRAVVPVADGGDVSATPTGVADVCIAHTGGI